MAAQGDDKLAASRQGVVGGLTVDDIRNYIQNNLTQGYSVFPIWVEENGNLSNNNRQWSGGNGSVGNVNFPLLDCDIFAVSLHGEIEGTSVSIDLMKNDALAETVTFSGGSRIIDLTTPLSYVREDLLGYRTNTVVGTWTDARILAWIRIPFLGLKGADGSQ